MKSRFFCLILILTTIGGPSCSLFVSKESEAFNQSALYDPPMVKLIKGKTDQFEEGVLLGRGQVFHSDYSYQNAFLFGLNPPKP